MYPRLEAEEAGNLETPTGTEEKSPTKAKDPEEQPQKTENFETITGLL